MNKDYYKSLGIDKKASKDDIKKAFYKLASKHHPDKGGDESKFKEVNEAYQILSDEKKRKEYDMYGQTFNGGGSSQSGYSNTYGGFNPQDFQGMQFDMDDLGDIFGDMFGGFGFGGFGDRQRRGRDISMEIEVSFKEAVFGTERNVVINRTSKCATCKGAGGDVSGGKVTCTKCNGKGRLYEEKRTILGNIQTNRECAACNATGEVYKSNCKDCKGMGIKDARVEVNIQVPAGISSGEMVKMGEMGEAVKGGISGDMYIKVRVREDKVWQRMGTDLVMNHSIKLSDAMLGFSHTIDGLDGPIEIKVEAGTQIGEKIRVSGRGIPITNKRRGDAIINLQIELPKRLSKKVKELFESLKEEGI